MILKNFLNFTKKFTKEKVNWKIIKETAPDQASKDHNPQTQRLGRNFFVNIFAGFSEFREFI